MPHTTAKLILGPARSGKTQRALERYCAALERWTREPTASPSLWIGPTPSALNDVRDRLAERAKGAWLNPKLATFATLAEEIIAQGRRRVRPISALEKQRILAHVVDALVSSKHLKHFAVVATTPGFLRQVSAAIANLKRRDVWPEEFRDRARNDRDHDFARIYAAYQDHLHAHQLYDAEGRLWAAREELTKSPSPAITPELWRREARGGVSGSETRFNLIVLDGFADFTPSQHDLLKLLADRCESLLITLPADVGGEPRELLFDKPQRTLGLLLESFPQLERETASESRYRLEGMAHVERVLFRDSIEVGSTANGLSIIAANSVQGEIREIARRVKELVLSGEARPGDIAVVFPSLEEMATRVEDVFDDFGLPLALESRQRLAATPLVRALLKLLRLVAEDWPFDLLLDVMGSMNTPLPSREGLGEGDSRPALERCIRRAQLPAGRTLLLEQLREWAAAVPRDTESDLPRERLRFARDAAIALEALSQLEAGLNYLLARSTLPGWIANIEALLGQFNLLTADGARVWQLLKKQLGLIIKTDARFSAEPKSTDTAEFLDLLQRVAGDTFLPRPSNDCGRVRVLSAESARNISVKHVFLAGLSEQSYSSSEVPGTLYREAEIQRFAGIGPHSGSPEQQAGEAMLLFYDMVTRASESLTLSYPALDDKGQLLTPSPYLTELERCFAPGAIPTTVMPAGSTFEDETTPLSRSDWRTLGMAAALDGKPHWLAGLIASPASKQMGRAILRSLECLASRSDREIFGPFEGLLASDAARAAIAYRYNAEHLWSPSQLETYATCPYQFFAAQVLGIEPLEEIALRSDHLRRGNLLHQVLAAIHAQQSETMLDGNQLIERFTNALERIIADSPLRGLEDALREIERREIHSWATSYAKQEIDYRNRWQRFDEPLVPTHFEVRFGPKARAGDAANDAVSIEVPFVLDLGTEQIKLTGQIDRIDMGRIGGVTVFNIIDYKSGKEVKLTDQEICAGRQLQLPLYALAAERLLFADRQAVALATGYWSIQARGFAAGRTAMLELRTHGESGLAESPRWSELNASINQRITEIIRGVRSAQFPVYNEDPHCTRFCDYSKICRIAQIRSLEKVWIPPPP